MKYNFKLIGKGSILCSVNGQRITVQTGGIITIDDKDTNYSYFCMDKKWEIIKDTGIIIKEIKKTGKIKRIWRVNKYDSL